MTDRRSLTFRVPAPLAEALKAEAEETGISLTELAIRYLRGTPPADAVAAAAQGDRLAQLEQSVSRLEGQVATLQSLLIEILRKSK